jgi:hypothetical protein
MSQFVAAAAAILRVHHFPLSSDTLLQKAGQEFLRPGALACQEKCAQALASRQGPNVLEKGC